MISRRHGSPHYQLAQAAAAITVVGLISMTLCLAALRGRVKRNSQA